MCIDMKKLRFVHFALAVVLLSSIRIILVLAGIIPLLSEASLWSDGIIALMLITLFAAGWRFYEDKWKSSVYKGAIAMAAAYFVIAAGILIGHAFGKQVLGIPIVSGFSLFLIIIINLFVYMLMGAVAVLVGAFFSRMFRKKEKKIKRK